MGRFAVLVCRPPLRPACSDKQDRVDQCSARKHLLQQRVSFAHRFVGTWRSTKQLMTSA